MRETLPRQDQHSHLRPISKPPRERQRSYRTSGHTNPFWPGKLERSQEEVDQVELVRVIESLEEGLKVLIEENSSLSREISEWELIGATRKSERSMEDLKIKLLASERSREFPRDPSAEQQDQNRPSRLERKGQLYLIKLKLDCWLMCPPRLPQIGSDLLCESLRIGYETACRTTSPAYGFLVVNQSGVLIMKDTVNLKLDSGAVRSTRIIKEIHEDNDDNDEDGGDGSSLRIRSNQRWDSKLARSERIWEGDNNKISKTKINKK
ncbi:hypothetical protein PPACK8108_LOCUS25399 [Phakopsora pachyrhizi]|uniref:Uncharacterized protein n=1 Tax=Phakopsora pachyrhizi TaxID=170000 RepID=A0AAV0BVL8_PHAPC|nr:hypothetical protein PPACK8108_LOCUS25399 [Phakopsora pachyrhizi]